MPRHQGKNQRFALNILRAVALSLITFSAFSAEVYKWTDEYGNTHYSDKKPNNSQHESLRVYSGKTSAQRKDIYDIAKTIDSNAEKADELKKKAEEEAKQKEKLAEQCKIIRENLRTISESGRIKVREDNGASRFLSPEEIANKRKKHEQQLKEFCL